MEKELLRVLRALPLKKRIGMLRKLTLVILRVCAELKTPSRPSSPPQRFSIPPRIDRN